MHPSHVKILIGVPIEPDKAQKYTMIFRLCLAVSVQDL
jgi:hypothetical protein